MTHRALLVIAVCLIPLYGSLGAQQSWPTYTEREKAEARQKIDAGTFDMRELWLVYTSKDRDAIPALEKQFPREVDWQKKGQIACDLVYLGDNDNRYWLYIAGEALKVLRSDAPDPVDPRAPLTAEEPPDDFKRWSKQHGLDLKQAIRRVVVDNMLMMDFVAYSEDPRAIPILRDALYSPLYFVQLEAAKGLAQLHDESSVPKIIELCEKAPPGFYAKDFAESLAFMDGDAAHREAEKYLGKDKVQRIQEARLRGTTLFHQ